MYICCLCDVYDLIGGFVGGSFDLEYGGGGFLQKGFG